MSKDQAIGGGIFLICVIITIGYIVALFMFSASEGLSYWLVAVPVLIALVAVLGIGAWIGWTMATTPPPKPIEEIEAEEKQEEEREEIKAGEKKT